MHDAGGIQNRNVHTKANGASCSLQPSKYERSPNIRIINLALLNKLPFVPFYTTGYQIYTRYLFFASYGPGRLSQTIMPLSFRRHLSEVEYQLPKVDRKPVYIYPGVIRMSKRRAVAIDTNCPATLFVQPRISETQNHHSCSICLDQFMSGKDIIRRLPCGHVFHSKCKLLLSKGTK